MSWTYMFKKEILKQYKENIKISIGKYKNSTAL